MKKINEFDEVIEVIEVKGESGIYALCGSCENPIYQHMDENKGLWDDTHMCGACATGESATYIDEL